MNTNTKLYQKSQALEITLFQLISWYILGSQGLNQLSQSNDDNVKKPRVISYAYPELKHIWMARE